MCCLEEMVGTGQIDLGENSGLGNKRLSFALNPHVTSKFLFLVFFFFFLIVK